MSCESGAADMQCTAAEVVLEGQGTTRQPLPTDPSAHLRSMCAGQNLLRQVTIERLQSRHPALLTRPAAPVCFKQSRGIFIDESSLCSNNLISSQGAVACHNCAHHEEGGGADGCALSAANALRLVHKDCPLLPCRPPNRHQGVTKLKWSFGD